ncbi:hypothetical protein BCV69DRAFT_280673 [Microstroma glucosiphilum]|uniref:Uncharacterized protein n=1 Tax=Pseudomicrostroma glucosiphilum TaxID=1684307 RepID=A0A316UDU0_9BASI|nr:hypothetical protein BCV69DRAFT_280673 [Pseudomicrostroma glucosiphilum]PWN23058.1 hypothetical protein BCV69DRAFT_280673 [Pseudomicrostroma glucosiphilum]
MPTSYSASSTGGGSGGLNITGGGEAATSEDGLQGYSSSSSSSIYQHPFASFNFGPSTPTDTTSSLSSRMKDASLSPTSSFNQRAHAGADQTVTDLNGPPSPAMSFTGSQHSMDDYDTDSPNSLYSWSSFMSGQRGDLADVEDLELGEPELETVSELDEENFSANGSDGPNLESDDDSRAQTPDGLRFGESLNRKRTITQHRGGASQHHHLHNHLVGQSGHGLPHFSPRSGGHGLSHHSRWTSRIPASVVARRRKGRIAELAEEGGGDVITGNVGINTTKMPSKEAAEKSASNAPSSSVSGKSTVTPRSSDSSGYPGTPPSTQWSEFSGPPALPVRSVSPSETVPVVPSPLCEFISASMAEGEAMPSGTAGEGSESKASDADKSAHPSGTSDDKDTGDQSTTSTVSRTLSGEAAAPLAAPTARRGLLTSATATDVSGTQNDGSPPDTASSGSFTTNNTRPASPETTPPSSPTQPLGRKDSFRARRSSSPVQLPSKSKAPLRPCFSRRNSTQSGRSTRESSMERERGRCHVRFSPAPPQTIRTHSPIEYDRSSCAVHNRLSVEDVQELHNLNMDMGLLSAKCSAIAAITSCKLPNRPGSSNASASSSPSSHAGSTDSPSLHPCRDSLAPEDALSSRPEHAYTGRARSNSSRGPSSPGDFGHIAPAKSLSSEGLMSPAEHLRAQREKERERACIMAGIGTGLGGRNLGRGVRGQTTNPLIARFGLTTPPPPLPSAGFASRSAGSGSRSAPSTPYDMPSSPVYVAQQQHDEPKTMSDRSRSPRASSLQRTANEERAMLRSMALSNKAVAAAIDDSETECDEPRAGKTPGSAPMTPSGSFGSTPRGRTTVRKDEAKEVTPSTLQAAGSTSLPDVVTTSPSPPPGQKAMSDPSSVTSALPVMSPVETPSAGDVATPLCSASSRSSPSRASDSYFSHKPTQRAEEPRKWGSYQQGSPSNASPYGSSPSTPYGGSSSPWNDPTLLSGGAGGCRAGRGGYDSPGSGFESGSEYDLLG